MSEQLVLPRPSEQLLTQEKSLALVQIFINASLACIAHTRELIPWTSPCFRVRYIDQINAVIDADEVDLYRAFSALEGESTDCGQEIRFLIRGGHTRADQMLEMLEDGIFEALQRSYLDTLQVFITKAADPRAVLETYSFAFKYVDGRLNSILLAPTSRSLVLENFQKSFKSVIRALLRSLQDLPRLPAHRRLGMSLVYNDDCPPKYQPPGFVDQQDFPHEAGDKICNTLWDDGWSMVGKLETGHHQVAVGVRSLHSEKTTSFVDPHDTAMSKQLQAMQKTSSQPITNLTSTLRDSGSRRKRANNVLIPAKRLKVAHGQEVQEDGVQKQVNSNQPAEETEDPKHPSATGIVQQASIVSSNASVNPSQRSAVEHPRRLVASKLAQILIHCYAIQRGVTGTSPVFDENLLAGGMIKRRLRSSRVKYVEQQGILLHKDGFHRMLDPCNFAERTLDKALADLVEEHILLPRDKQSWQLQALSKDGIQGVQEKFLDPLAYIEHLYENDVDETLPLQRTTLLADELKRFAQGCDFTAAEGCHEFITYDDFDQKVSRWGYYEDTSVLKGDRCLTGPSPAAPVLRRKISISRALIDIDRSAPDESSGIEEFSQPIGDIGYSSDFASTSTATAD
ncbi:hypothetical protein LTR99_003580 [Exophiala xenobiotica]|uniref:HORMA domain-containing protein n=1 Tax=Vermiconidia calcicola TaxID=1690605 RepID=A0AAV9PXS6_9PEZI|nr:hypothetical protein LTR96_010290 [Exophiala xenobiotica]KAK5531275.1 hypothetical protein LTR25_008382 [Vermiconidia calcicola]KAK5540659.1 hypothetical protein LTR23_006120 [Chaetothyriales sp. CCFEE 6169]KAK5304517.1 hypothetical protein LTR99_003580 [Exophiala xenobiotica]KAK5333177.1 hypothetical protein LTR98_010704 [Exophiala xenobiotica]